MTNFANEVQLIQQKISVKNRLDYGVIHLIINCSTI